MAARLDWGFTDDGDLSLGEPQLDANGNKLYRHFDGTVDTTKGSEGKELRDLTYSYSLGADKQIIMNRLKTDTPDWFHHPNMGGNLSDMVGEPNTKETGFRGADYITAALTYGNLYAPSEVSVKPIPISMNEMLFLITITKFRQNPYQIPLTFNLEHGLLKIYGE